MRVVKWIMTVKMSGNPFIGFAVFMRMTMLFGKRCEDTVAFIFSLCHRRIAIGVGHTPERRDSLEHHRQDDDKTKLSLPDQDLML